MITVKEATTKKLQREFVNYPVKLYKDNPNFVPPLYGDEMKMFKKDYVYNDMCDSVLFIAYDENGKMVGRIQGILQRVANEKIGEKRVRFTRFDSIDDQEVAGALFASIEDWARMKGMDTICGPLGYSDLEREGMLIEGFEYLSTFCEQYNAPYYQKLVENLGYEKEVDWTESRLTPPDEGAEDLAKMSEFVMKRYNLHYGPAKNVNDFLKKYADGFFELLDKAYNSLYGTVPFTDGMKKMMIDNFKLIVKLKYVAVILDENDKIVCLGICFPCMGEAVRKSKGHLTPLGIIRILHAINHPKQIELGLIAVNQEYMNKGVSTCICSELINMLKNDNLEFAETNLNLENNFAIRNSWKRFNEHQHKRRRSFIKKLTETRDD